MHRPIGPLTGCSLVVLALAAGCARSPMSDDNERDLRRSVIEGARRELSDAERKPASVTLSRDDLVAQLAISPEAMNEIRTMAGPESYERIPLVLGTNLLEEPVRTAPVSLERAVRSAVNNNLAVQFARLGPAISEAQLQSAEAAFDFTFFSNLNWNNTDTPTTRSSFSGSTSPVFSNQLYSATGQAGVRRTLLGGGRLTVQLDNAYTENHTPGQVNTPNPAQTAAFTVQWDQPLLRNAGSEVTQAEIRVARNAERNAVQQLRRDLGRVVTDTEKAYWDLERAEYDIQILRRLLERGEKVRDQLANRLTVNVNEAQVADARARVERRRADLQQAQIQLRLVSDRLKQLMNDPDLPVGSEIVVLPVDRPVDAPVRFSLLESMRQAIAYRPEIQQSILAIDDASIRQMVARSGRLPDLTMRLQARWSALDNSMGESYGKLFKGEFIDYLAGLAFEVPIGNRKAEADYRRRSLERMQSVIAYRNQVQQTVQDVKASLDRVVNSYRQIAQRRNSRLATANSLRVLEVEKDIAQYTPERLDLELNRQEQLAAAERDEVQAMIDYNQSIADLFLAIGTTLERNRIQVNAPTTDDTLGGMLAP